MLLHNYRGVSYRNEVFIQWCYNLLNFVFIYCRKSPRMPINTGGHLNKRLRRSDTTCLQPHAKILIAELLPMLTKMGGILSYLVASLSVFLHNERLTFPPPQLCTQWCVFKVCCTVILYI